MYCEHSKKSLVTAGIISIKLLVVVLYAVFCSSVRAQVIAISDNFDDNEIDASIWRSPGLDDYPSRYPVEQNGRLEIVNDGTEDDSTGLCTQMNLPADGYFQVQVSFNASECDEQSALLLSMHNATTDYDHAVQYAMIGNGVVEGRRWFAIYSAGIGDEEPVWAIAEETATATGTLYMTYEAGIIHLSYTGYGQENALYTTDISEWTNCEQVWVALTAWSDGALLSGSGSYFDDFSLSTSSFVEDNLDIDLLGISAAKQFRDGIPQGEFPWSLDIAVFLADPDNLHHIDVTKPGDSESFVTLYEEAFPPGCWGCSLDDDYASLIALRAVYPEGTYRFEFRDIDGVLIRSLNIDYTGLPDEPAEPVEFTYPSTDGQTGISVNPTFIWSLSSDAGDALMMAIDNDEVVYFDAPVPISSTSWTPGPLLADHQYELDVLVINVKDWASGPGFPTMTDSTGDTFSYAHTIEYLNEIVFTTVSSSEPIYEIEEILDFVDESMDVGTLTGDGPGNSADNRLNALINMLEDVSDLIEGGLYEEACDQLWSAYKKCDGDPRPPDFVTGDAADDLADMILLMIDQLGCE